MGAIGFDNGGQLLVNSHPLQTGFKNYIIDGRFDFWYEGTSQTTSGYGSDTMWFNYNTVSTKTHTRQSFAVGETFPDGTLCPMYYSRTTSTFVNEANSVVKKMYNIEDITRLAGKTVTLSFYAKANTSIPLYCGYVDFYGSGGTPSANGLLINKIDIFNLTTTWQKFTKTFTFPSISGKTLGTDGVHTTSWRLDFGTTFSSDRTEVTSYGMTAGLSGTFDIAMVQLEEGSVATEFEWNGIGVEESRVGRYYNYYSPILALPMPQCNNGATLQNWTSHYHNQHMRANPSLSATSYNLSGHHNSVPSYASYADHIEFAYGYTDARAEGGVLSVFNAKFDARL